MAKRKKTKSKAKSSPSVSLGTKLKNIKKVFAAKLKEETTKAHNAGYIKALIDSTKAQIRKDELKTKALLAAEDKFEKAFAKSFEKKIRLKIKPAKTTKAKKSRKIKVKTSKSKMHGKSVKKRSRSAKRR